jgi:hypothetical protein
MAALAALALAAVVAVWSGLTVRASLRPAVDEVLGPGESAVVEGLRITFDGFDSLSWVPPADETGSGWRAPAGAVAVVARYRVELADPAATGSSAGCSAGLRRGDTTWGSSPGVFAPLGEGGPLTSCVPSEEDWQPDPQQPRSIALPFVIPAAATSDLQVVLDFWYDERTVIALRDRVPLPSAAPHPSR